MFFIFGTIRHLTSFSLWSNEKHFTILLCVFIHICHIIVPVWSVWAWAILGKFCLWNVIVVLPNGVSLSYSLSLALSLCVYRLCVHQCLRISAKYFDASHHRVVFPHHPLNSKQWTGIRHHGYSNPMKNKNFYNRFDSSRNAVAILEYTHDDIDVFAFEAIELKML